MTLAQQLAARRKQWQAFHEWEDSYVHPAGSASQNIADVSAIWSMLPEDERLRDPDPEKKGVQRYHEILARHFSKR